MTKKGNLPLRITTSQGDHSIIIDIVLKSLITTHVSQSFKKKYKIVFPIYIGGKR